VVPWQGQVLTRAPWTALSWYQRHAGRWWHGAALDKDLAKGFFASFPLSRLRSLDMAPDSQRSISICYACPCENCPRLDPNLPSFLAFAGTVKAADRFRRWHCASARRPPPRNPRGFMGWPKISGGAGLFSSRGELPCQPLKTSPVLPFQPPRGRRPRPRPPFGRFPLDCARFGRILKTNIGSTIISALENHVSGFCEVASMPRIGHDCGDVVRAILTSRITRACLSPPSPFPAEIGKSIPTHQKPRRIKPMEGVVEGLTPSGRGQTCLV
jgi:hypothetical protein